MTHARTLTATAALAAAAVPQAAWAHPGHGFIDMAHGLLDGVQHLLTSPDHLAGLFILGAAAYGVRRLILAKQTRNA